MHLKIILLIPYPMNKLLFIYKFLTKKHDSQKINWSFIFPFIGVIFGSIIISLTVAIMEGMENSIFYKLEQLSYPARLVNVLPENVKDIKGVVNEDNINKSLKEKVVISSDIDFRVVNMLGLEDYEKFTNEVLKSHIIDFAKIKSSNNIYLGKNLASRLNLAAGDSAYISNSKSINIFTGIPNTIQVVIAGIFDINLIDYNQNYIYSSYNLINKLIQPESYDILLNKELDLISISLIKKINNKISYYKWNDDYQSFISAMKLEKIIYSLIGFLIILIAAFTLMSMMSLSVMKKIPQLGILMSIGIKKHQIKYIFLFQSIITGVIGSLVGIIISQSIIFYDKKYQLIEIFFEDQMFFDFPLILTNMNILLIFLLSLIILILSGLYPAIKASTINFLARSYHFIHFTVTLLITRVLLS